MDRVVLNYQQAMSFARRHRRPLFVWQHKLTGVAAGWLSDDEQQQLHRAEKGLRGCFVAGAPATITYNIETGRGLVNGDATMHSLTLANGESVASLVEEARHDPSRWDDGACGQPGRSTALRQRRPDRGRRDTRLLLARGATLDADGSTLVVPVLIGRFSVEYWPTSVHAAQACVPKVLRIMKHQIDLAFAVTDYKARVSPRRTCTPRGTSNELSRPPCAARRCKARRSTTFWSSAHA